MNKYPQDKKPQRTRNVSKGEKSQPYGPQPLEPAVLGFQIPNDRETDNKGSNLSLR